MLKILVASTSECHASGFGGSAWSYRGPCSFRPPAIKQCVHVRKSFVARFFACVPGQASWLLRVHRGSIPTVTCPRAHGPTSLKAALLEVQLQDRNLSRSGARRGSGRGLRNRWRGPAAGSLRPRNPPLRRSEITPDFGPKVQLEDRKSFDVACRAPHDWDCSDGVRSCSHDVARRTTLDHSSGIVRC
jgi:hypothetical protein